MKGRAVDDYDAPLFLAWQLTNRCAARCLACCEESGPDKAWADELSQAEALDLTDRIVAAGIPYVAFGGGEPLGVPHCWEIFERLAGAGIALKIETDGRHIDEAGADRLAALGVECVQISVDGACAETHERVRPGSPFADAVGAIERLVARGLPPQMVFVPTRLNIGEAVAAYELALSLGCSAFVTGPMMRLGRAAADWDGLSVDDAVWAQTAEDLRARAADPAAQTALSVYPWDIPCELEHQLESPHAMLLIVPNGKVKILNALPFAPADLRTQSLEEAWAAYKAAWRSDTVRGFVADCIRDPKLLRHANETWGAEGAEAGRPAAG